MTITQFRLIAAAKFLQICTQHTVWNNYMVILKRFGSGPSKSIIPAFLLAILIRMVQPVCDALNFDINFWGSNQKMMQIDNAFFVKSLFLEIAGVTKHESGINFSISSAIRYWQCYFCLYNIALYMTIDW